jgi:MoaA/NifB/PqqE/SkfB family radical SAM enzyme
MIKKYPLEIEFTNNCSLKCKVCISKDIKTKWFLAEDTFDLILKYILENKDYIDYITIWWLWDNFLHPKILLFLDKLKILKSTSLPILIPTKWMTITEEIVLKITELKNLWIKINIQIGLFSINNSIQDYLTWTPNLNYFSKLSKTIKLFKNNKVDFSFELLLTKLSENEIEAFYKFCDKLQVDGVVHKLHNFWARLKAYNSLSSLKNYNAFHCSFNKSKENDINDYYNDLCWFFPYINFEWNIYPGTFCLHYKPLNIKSVMNKNYDFIIDYCKKIINMENENCKKCSHNSNNIKQYEDIC